MWICPSRMQQVVKEVDQKAPRATAPLSISIQSLVHKYERRQISDAQLISTAGKLRDSIEDTDARLAISFRLAELGLNLPVVVQKESERSGILNKLSRELSRHRTLLETDDEVNKRRWSMFQALEVAGSKDPNALQAIISSPIDIDFVEPDPFQIRTYDAFGRFLATQNGVSLADFSATGEFPLDKQKRLLELLGMTITNSNVSPLTRAVAVRYLTMMNRESVQVDVPDEMRELASKSIKSIEPAKLDPRTCFMLATELERFDDGMSAKFLREVFERTNAILSSPFRRMIPESIDRYLPAALRKSLFGGDSAQLEELANTERGAIDLAGKMLDPQLRKALLRIVQDDSRSYEVRFQALKQFQPYELSGMPDELTATLRREPLYGPRGPMANGDRALQFRNALAWKCLWADPLCKPALAFLRTALARNALWITEESELLTSSALKSRTDAPKPNEFYALVRAIVLNSQTMPWLGSLRTSFGSEIERFYHNVISNLVEHESVEGARTLATLVKDGTSKSEYRYRLASYLGELPLSERTTAVNAIANQFRKYQLHDIFRPTNGANVAANLEHSAKYFPSFVFSLGVSRTDMMARRMVPAQTGTSRIFLFGEDWSYSSTDNGAYTSLDQMLALPGAFQAHEIFSKDHVPKEIRELRHTDGPFEIIIDSHGDEGSIVLQTERGKPYDKRKTLGVLNNENLRQSKLFVAIRSFITPGSHIIFQSCNIAAMGKNRTSFLQDIGKFLADIPNVTLWGFPETTFTSRTRRDATGKILDVEFSDNPADKNPVWVRGVSVNTSDRMPNGR